MALPIKWRKRDGTVVKIAAMDAPHLADTIELINRRIMNRGIRVFHGKPNIADINKFLFTVDKLKEYQLAMQLQLWKRNTQAVLAIKGEE